MVVVARRRRGSGGALGVEGQPRRARRGLGSCLERGSTSSGAAGAVPAYWGSYAPGISAARRSEPPGRGGRPPCDGILPRLRDGWGGWGRRPSGPGQPFAHCRWQSMVDRRGVERFFARVWSDGKGFGFAAATADFWMRWTAYAERVSPFVRCVGSGWARCIIRHLLHFLCHNRDPEFGLPIVAWRAATPSREPPARRPCAVDQTPRRRRDSRH